LSGQYFKSTSTLRKFLPFLFFSNNYFDETVLKLNYEECYYDVIEVNRNISFEELKKAYYKLVFKYHPDQKQTEAEKELGNKQMMVINGAYRILKDPYTRAQYDLQCEKGFFGAKAGIKGTAKNDGSNFSSSKSKTNPQESNIQEKKQVESSGQKVSPMSPSASRYSTFANIKNNNYNNENNEVYNRYTTNKIYNDNYFENNNEQYTKEESDFLFKYKIINRGDGSLKSLKVDKKELNK
jgi:curved DNA-binding protein CbpA